MQINDVLVVYTIEATDSQIYLNVIDSKNYHVTSDSVIWKKS